MSGGPFGAGAFGTGSRRPGAAPEPVVNTREVGARDLSTQTVVLTDDRTFVQLLGADPERRDGATVFIDPSTPNLRAFLCGSQLDAQQARNGVPMLSSGPLYGYEVPGGCAAFAYLDPALVGTIDALGGLNIFVVYASGVSAPAGNPSAATDETSEA